MTDSDNTLAYFDTELITVVKSFTVQAQGGGAFLEEFSTKNQTKKRMEKKEKMKEI